MTFKKRSMLLLTLVPLALPAGARAQQPAAPQAESVCIQCHAKLPEKLGAPVQIWRASIHAASGIYCYSCHGGDPKSAGEAMSPARGFLGVPAEIEVPGFCGRCHPGVLKDYQASAHGRALGKGGPTCVTCHGSHEVVRATPDLISEKNCSRCHSYQRAGIIKDAMRQTEAYLGGIERRIGSFQSTGVDTGRLEKGLFAVRNSYHSLFHEVNVARVRSESGRINAELAKLDADLKLLEQSRGRRKVAGGFVVSGLLLIALLAHLVRKELK